MFNKCHTGTALLLCRIKSETVWQLNSASVSPHFNRIFSLNMVTIVFYVAHKKKYIKKKINFVRELLQKSGACVYCSYLHFARMVNCFDTKNVRFKKNLPELHEPQEGAITLLKYE